MMKILLSCFLMLIVGDFVCHGNIQELKIALDTCAKECTKKNKDNAIAILSVVLEEIRTEMAYLNNLLNKKTVTGEQRQAGFTKIKDLFGMMVPTVAPTILLTFSDGIFPIINPILKPSGFNSPDVIRLKSAVDSYKKGTLGTYLKNVETNSVYWIKSDFENITDFYKLAAHPEFKDQLKTYDRAFSQALLNLLGVLSNTEHINELLKMWPVLQVLYDKLDGGLNLKKSEFVRICKLTETIAMATNIDDNSQDAHYNLILYLIKTISFHKQVHSDKAAETLEARSNVLTNGRYWLSEYRPIDAADATLISQKIFSDILNHELENPEIISDEIVEDMYSFCDRFEYDDELKPKINEWYSHMLSKYSVHRKRYEKNISVLKLRMDTQQPSAGPVSKMSFLLTSPTSPTSPTSSARKPIFKLSKYAQF